MRALFDNPLYVEFFNFYNTEVNRALSEVDITDLRQFASLVVDTKEKRGTVYSFGNGGSASIASHFVHNLNWDVSANVPDKQKIKAFALNEQICHMTGVANDRHYDQVFVAQLRNLLEQDDLVVGISGSGNSENVVTAIKYSKAREVRCITLTGCGGGVLAKLGDLNIIVQSLDQQVTEDVQHSICHIIIRMLYYYNVGIVSDRAFQDIARLREKTLYIKQRKLECKEE